MPGSAQCLLKRVPRAGMSPPSRSGPPYEQGRLGGMHRQIAEHAAVLALAGPATGRRLPVVALGDC
ncbi:MAG: hypothetical protein ABSE77_16395 [Acidimicrobiales bacterium]